MRQCNLKDIPIIHVSYVAGSMCTMNEHIHRRWGYTLFGHIKNPEKQNTIINITVISQSNYNITITIPFTTQFTQ